MSSSLRRLAVVLTLAVLFAPGFAQAAPRLPAQRIMERGFLSLLWNVLVAPWLKNGAELDPAGRGPLRRAAGPSTTTAPNSIRAVGPDFKRAARAGARLRSAAFFFTEDKFCVYAILYRSRYREIATRRLNGRD